MGMIGPGGGGRCPSRYLPDLALVTRLEDFQLTQLKAHFKGEALLIKSLYNPYSTLSKRDMRC